MSRARRSALPKNVQRKLAKYIAVAILTLFGVYTVTGEMTVVDGDTLRLGMERVRLQGIDAPESAQTCKCGGEKVYCGKIATQALKDFIGDAKVSCDGDDRDMYGRLTAECFVQKNGRRESVNRFMVAQGYALAYRRYSKKFVADEERAKAGKKGIWACSFDEPWQWRRAKRGKKASKR